MSEVVAEADAHSGEKLRYRRVVLKLSGESLADASGRGIDGDEAGHIARQIQNAHSSGCQIAIVIGGGNILRGAQFSDGNQLVQEATAHHMGMLATTINALALHDALETLGAPFIEVHLSDVAAREPFRKVSVIRDIAARAVWGRGVEGYRDALDAIPEIAG